MTPNQKVTRQVRDELVHARVAQEAELVATRGYALKIISGTVIGAAASLSELGNLFAYWRRLSEDQFGDISTAGTVVTLAFSLASFFSLAYSIDAFLNWMRGRDENPPFVSVTIGLLSLGLSVAFPIYQAGVGQDVLWTRCFFSLLSTIVAGLALHTVLTGFALKKRHEAAGEAIGTLDDGIDKFTREVSREASRGRRMGSFEEELKEAYAIAFVQAHDDAFDALKLAVDNEGLPVAPIEGRVQKLLVGRSVGPEVNELIELTAGTTAIGVHRRLSGRSMSAAEMSAVRRFLRVVHRPTQADILRALNA